jgi:tryptophan synthase alpha chain
MTRTPNRIDRLFAGLKASRRKALVAYLVAGDPSPDATPGLVRALEESGADVIELGVPFSDPLADGTVNQLGSQRALDAGTTLAGVLDMVKRIRARSEIPLVLFTYYNPVFHFGLEKFAAAAEAAGVDGILLLDLPPEEAEEWPAGTALKRISLIAPTTPAPRVQAICAQSSGFLYYVSREGVTGMQQGLPGHIQDQLAVIQEATRLPVCVGFGISSPEQAAFVAGLADGVVVGSAIVDRIGKAGSPEAAAEAVRAFVTPLAAAVHSAGDAA